jgi:glucose/arabinose dehydrogenase
MRAGYVLSLISEWRIHMRRGRKGIISRLLIGVAILSAVASVPTPASASVGARRIVSDLRWPVSFTFDRQERIFYALLNSGYIRIFDPASSSDSLFFAIPNATDLSGIALHPQYPLRPYVYAYVARRISGTLRLQVVRITDEDGVGSSLRVLKSWRIESLFGGRILFGPDGKLYVVIGVVTGESSDQRNAQDLDHHAGKIMRMTARGSIPKDNPFPESYVFASGFRNSLGFAFDVRAGSLWQTDNGAECNDELNVVVPGGNYGWGPSATCDTPPNPPRNTNQDGPEPRLPKLWYTPNIAPTGTAFCEGCDLGSGTDGRLFFGAWNTGEIRSVTLDSSRSGVASQQVVYTHPRGILALEAAPSGELYFSDRSGIYKLVAS